MCSKCDHYFTFASFLIPPQINKFDVHLYIFALFAKYYVYFQHKVEANMVQIYLFASLFTHITEASTKNIYTSFTQLLLQEQICSYTLRFVLLSN